ncbi:hypothetical protein BAY61_24805 [Prauserella marina]|nr:hypothetical protein BAY61_24805 [Prauserella marina]
MIGQHVCDDVVDRPAGANGGPGPVLGRELPQQADKRIVLSGEQRQDVDARPQPVGSGVRGGRRGIIHGVHDAELTEVESNENRKRVAWPPFPAFLMSVVGASHTGNDRYGREKQARMSFPGPAFRLPAYAWRRKAPVSRSPRKTG